MDVRPLQQFLALAETLHFGRAAAASHISASTLSRAILRLEESVGCALFIRDKRTVALTAAGIRFHDYARDAIARWEQLQQALLQDASQLSGQLTLYGSVTASHSFLFELLAKLRDLHPGIEINLQTGDPEAAITRVQSGGAHVSLGAKPARLPKALQFKSIATTELTFIAARHSTLAQNKKAQPAARIDWLTQPLILPERGVARDHALSWFRKRKVLPQIAHQVAGNEAIVTMVSLGDSVGLVPRIVLDNSPLADKVLRLPVPQPPKPLEVGLFTREHELKNRLVAALWDLAG
ncbi:MAG: HTH-type transcriptional activator IlvY [Pseudomonadota bacterium]